MGYAEVLDKCRTNLQKYAKSVRANRVAFAKYVAMRIRDTTHVTHADGERRPHVKVFNEKRGMWMVRRRDDMASIVAATLAGMVRPAAMPR